MLQSPRLRTLLAGWTLAWIAIHAWLTGVTLYAFDLGGAGAVGVVIVARQFPQAVAVPALAWLADRVRRNRLLAGGAAVGAVSAFGACAGAVLSLPLAIPAAAAAVQGIGEAQIRTAYSGAIPQACETSVQATTVNGLSSTAVGAALAVGPLLVAAIFVVGSPAAVFAVVGTLLAAAAVLLVRVGIPAPEPTKGPGRSVLAELLAGADVLIRKRSVGSIVADLAVGDFVLGALRVIAPAIAFGLLGIGNSGVALMLAAIGGGAVIGGIAIGLWGTGLPNGIVFGSGAVLLAAALIAAAAFPELAPVFTLLGLAGVGYAAYATSGNTMLQGIVPNDRLARTMGVYVVASTVAGGVGGFAASGLIEAIDVRWSVAGVAATLLIAVAITRPGLREAEQEFDRAAPLLEFLGEVDIVRPLPLTAKAGLVGAAESLQVSRGEIIVQQGQVDDRLFMIRKGEFTAELDGTPVREMGPTEVFGEIAVLRDVPRTATVRARTDGEVLAIRRAAFLTALHASAASTALATDLAQRRSAGSSSTA